MVANRIDPLGQFTTLPQRGGFMGNRGRLHDLSGQIRRSWQTKAWITCTLRDKPGRASPGVTPPNSYTRLFFLDESVACAAGHRPCAEAGRRPPSGPHCQRPRRGLRSVVSSCSSGCPRTIDGGWPQRAEPATMSKRNRRHSMAPLNMGTRRLSFRRIRPGNFSSGVSTQADQPA